MVSIVLTKTALSCSIIQFLPQEAKFLEKSCDKIYLSLFHFPSNTNPNTCVTKRGNENKKGE
jgi:hypothetical protein